MSEPKRNITEVTNRNQLLTDIFFEYDTNADSTISLEELPQKFDSDGISRTDLRKILLDPMKQKKLFAAAPKISRMWSKIEDQGFNSNRQLILAITPKLKNMPRSKAMSCVSLLRDLQLEMDIFAKRKINSEKLTKSEYLKYLEAYSSFLLKRAENMTPSEFEVFLKDAYKKNKKTKDPIKLIAEQVNLKEPQKEYKKLVDGFPKPGKWIYLFYDKGENKFFVETKEKRFKPEDENIVILAVRKRADSPKIYEQTLVDNCPWLIKEGEAFLDKAIEKAIAKIKEKDIRCQIKGLKHLTIDKLISKELIKSLIYTEQGWSDIIGAKEHNDVGREISRINARIGLEGNDAYALEASNKAARGIGQIRVKTYEDARDYVKGSINEDFETMVTDAEKSIYLMFIIVERKMEQIASNLRGTKWSSKDIAAYFNNNTCKDSILIYRPCAASHEAIAAAYNSCNDRAATFAQAGKIEGLYDGTENYVLSIRRIFNYFNQNLNGGFFVSK